jgi:hypothetical protein
MRSARNASSRQITSAASPISPVATPSIATQCTGRMRLSSGGLSGSMPQTVLPDPTVGVIPRTNAHRCTQDYPTAPKSVPWPDADQCPTTAS